MGKIRGVCETARESAEEGGCKFRHCSRDGGEHMLGHDMLGE